LKIWRDAFINDAVVELAKAAFAKLNSQSVQDIYRQDRAEASAAELASQILPSTAGKILPCLTA